MHATKDKMKRLDRLKKRSDFLRVQKEGTRWVARGLSVQAAENGTDRTRFGLVVTKRLCKTAVGRNRMKRRLRAAAYEILPDLARPGMDYVLGARQETPDRLYGDLCRDLKWCLGKLGFLIEREQQENS